MAKSRRKVFLAVGIFAVAFFVFSRFNSLCPVQTKIETVEGTSLAGLFEPGSRVRAQYGYYACHEPARGDLVLYRYAGEKNLLIKIIKAVPGDTMALKKNPQGTRILINGSALTNSSGEVYQLSDERARLLSLYVRDYHGVIPEAAYLIFGNLVTGTLASSQFGLVSRQDLIGRAFEQ